MSAVVNPHAMTNEPCDSGAQAESATHTLQLTAWDIPSAIGAGERLSLIVGARCSAGCDLGGKALTLCDEHSSQVCSVPLGREVWPGTEALYFAQIEAQAPRESGSVEWEARVAGWEGESPHAEGSVPLALRVVAAPDCEVKLRVVDRETQAPLAGARVVMHPYRAVTDGNGMVRLKVGRGRYDVLVSAHRYMSYCAGIEVNTDVTTNAELDADLPDEEAYE